MRFAPVVAIWMIAGCAARQPGSAGARFTVLGGLLSIAPSVAAQTEANRQERLMAATSSPARETVVKLRDGSSQGVVVFRLTRIPCRRDPAAAVKRLGESWRDRDGAFHIDPISDATFFYIPDQLPRRDEVTNLGAIVTCTSRGLVAGNVLVDGDPRTWSPIMRQLAGSIEAHTLPRTAARQIALRRCDKLITVDVPEGYFDDVEHGIDFTLYHFDAPDGETWMTIYTGQHSRPSAPAGATPIQLSGGVEAKRWIDQDGVHLERWWALDPAPVVTPPPSREPPPPSGPEPPSEPGGSASSPPGLTDEELAELAAQEPACIFLGFGEGPLSEEASLRRLLGYTMAADPGARR
jgi:hypothetical protein